MRVRVVEQALDAGFMVEDLSRILKQRDAGGAPCREVFRIVLNPQLAELDERIAELSASSATTSAASSTNGKACAVVVISHPAVGRVCSTSQARSPLLAVAGRTDDP